MADSTVLSPIQFLAGLRRISRRYLQAKEGYEPVYDAWDNANVARMEAEAAEEVDQALIDKLTVEESRLESEMMRFRELEDLIDSLSRELTHILGWPDEKIADALRRLETVNGLRALNRIDGSKLEDLQEFPGLLRALNELAWSELPLLPAWATKETAAIEAKHHVGGPMEPQPAIAEQAPSQTPSSNVEDGLNGPPLIKLLEFLVAQGMPYESTRTTPETLSKGLARFGVTIKRTSFQGAIKASQLLRDWKNKHMDEKLAERQRNWTHRSLEEAGLMYFAASSLPDPSDVCDSAYEERIQQAIALAIAKETPQRLIDDLRSDAKAAKSPEDRRRLIKAMDLYLDEGGREVAAASY